MNSPGRYLSIAEYADLAGVSHKTIRGMIARGELPAHRFGRVLRIDPDAAREVTAYRPADVPVADTDPDPAAPARPRPRPVRGEFARRARGLPASGSRR